MLIASVLAHSCYFISLFDHFYFSPFQISLFYSFSETPSICFLSRNLCSLVIIKLFCYIIRAPIFLQCICSTVISHHLLVNYQKSKKYAFMLIFCLFCATDSKVTSLYKLKHSPRPSNTFTFSSSITWE